MNLCRIIFVPAFCPPHKARPILAPFEHRFEMLKREVSKTPYFELSDVERKEVCPSYAGDTIRELKKLNGEENSYYFIIGFDSLLTLTDWEKSRIEPGLCSLICLTRPGFDKKTIISKLPEEYKRYIIFKNANPVFVSSTDIKERIRQNLPVQGMMPDGVYEYIKKFRIYTTSLT